MLSHLGRYTEPILSACLLFPFIAGLFTLPYLVRHYRRYGGVAFMRVIVVYSFVLYCMCAFFLTVLPLPTVEAVRNMPDQKIGWIPFYDLYVGFARAGFTQSPATWLVPAHWRSFLTSGDLFQILANIVMQIPLGFYLRYYFRRTWKQTLVIGLCVSLFYELTQLSGLFFLYPKPYRYTEVDDLINNTLGAMIGFWITPLFQKILPSRDDIDKISYDKGHRITVMRRLVAAVIDWVLFVILWFVVMLLPIQAEPSMVFVATGFFGYIAWVTLYFGVLQWLLKGRTAGKALLKIKVVTTKDQLSQPKLWQLSVRYFMIYFLTMPILGMVLMMLMLIGVFSLIDNMPQEYLIGLIVFCSATILVTMTVTFFSFKKHGMFPHGHHSRTTIVVTGPRKSFKELMEAGKQRARTRRESRGAPPAP